MTISPKFSWPLTVGTPLPIRIVVVYKPGRAFISTCNNGLNVVGLRLCSNYLY